MDKKIFAIIAVVIIVVAAVAVYVGVGGGNDDGNDDSSDVYALSIGGVAANEENVVLGDYPIQRNLNLCTLGASWILSTEGQEILGGMFVPLDNASETYTDPVGDVHLSIGGSTTIQPIMNELVQAYKEKYSDRVVDITVAAGGSGVGMCSRDLKDSEIALGLQETKIGMDGVALVVNGAGITDITMQQIADIYSGKITNWSEIGGVDAAIAVVARDSASGTGECFEDAMTNIDPSYELMPGVPEMVATNSVLEFIKSTPGSIGYVSIGSLADLDKDKIMKYVLTGIACVAVLVIFLIIVFIAGNSVDAISSVGILDFIFGSEWDPEEGIYGAFPVILGTILVTIGAMAIAIPLGVGCALYISEIAPSKYRSILKPVCEIFAGIPSVVYGFFGLVVLVPFLRETFDVTYGLSWLAASLLLGIMAMPTIISISEDALHAVPQSYREASLAMGASRWETTMKVVFPAAISGVSAAIILGIGRAIGETMAVMMVTGNVALVPDPLWNIFSLITTITGTMASEMPEVVVGSTHYSALFLLALILLVIVFFINYAARMVVKSTRRKMGYDTSKKTGPLAGISSALNKRLDVIRNSSFMSTIHDHRGTITGVISAVVIFVLIWMILSLKCSDVVSIGVAAIVTVALFGFKTFMNKANSNTAQKVAHGGLTVLMAIVILLLVYILGYIIIRGLPVIDWEFLTAGLENMGRDGGIYPMIIGTLQLLAGTIVISLPLGIIAGIYLAEYAKDNWLTKVIREAIDLLNGTPSIVFGLFGFTALVIAADFGYSMIAGWFTLSFMILPVIIRTTEEAFEEVPHELREASRAMGASKWKTTTKVIFPAALGGVMTGSILALGRSVGETAPIMFTAVAGLTTVMASSPFDPVMCLAYHLYYLSTEVVGAADMQYGTACILLLIVLVMFLIASIVRHYSNKKARW